MVLWRPEVWSKVAGTVATLLFRDPVSQVTVTGVGREPETRQPRLTEVAPAISLQQGVRGNTDRPWLEAVTRGRHQLPPRHPRCGPGPLLTRGLPLPGSWARGLRGRCVGQTWGALTSLLQPWGTDAHLGCPSLILLETPSEELLYSCRKLWLPSALRGRNVGFLGHAGV